MRPASWRKSRSAAVVSPFCICARTHSMDAVTLLKGGGFAARGVALGMGSARLAGAFAMRGTMAGVLSHFPAKAPRMRQSVVVDRVR